MPVFVIVKDEKGNVVDVVKRQSLSLKEAARSAYSLAPLAKQIAEGQVPPGLYTRFTSLFGPKLQVKASEVLTPERKREVLDKLNEFRPGDIISEATRRADHSDQPEEPQKPHPVIVIFRDP